METNFPVILKKLREKVGFESQTKFAEVSGVDNSTIARLERGETRPSPKTLEKLAPILGISLMELMAHAGYIDLSEKKITSDGFHALGYKQVNVKDLNKMFPLPDTELVKVPVLGSIKAGYDNVAEQEIIGYQLISRSNISDGEYFYLKVVGDSMVDAGIKEGYRVLVKQQNFVDQGKIAVVIINGDEGTLKRVYYQDSQVVLQSENADKKYPPRIINAEDVLIQGQVCKVEFDV
ncbi:S24 family peptidase [Desulfosporosinus sp.]|uniref:helix-turn-helix domain-containing protein n=1 Tax=Desulfosporosinus sp. TaxID=157907 RepID=UPI0023194005|nr:S24 family peptidase [Desulfosporosinus sp.]MDA8224206.1 helix-turn-helix domain-containing protein [Desulfitobacterium hafniense]